MPEIVSFLGKSIEGKKNVLTSYYAVDTFIWISSFILHKIPMKEVLLLSPLRNRLVLGLYFVNLAKLEL